MSWNLSNDRPIYLQLVEILERKILAGDFKLGEHFPTVRDLASEAAVNPNTMQRALQELERRGLLVTNRTAGRSVTQDATQIQCMREEFAQRSFENFKKEMIELGFSGAQMLEYVKKNVAD